MRVIDEGTHGFVISHKWCEGSNVVAGCDTLLSSRRETRSYLAFLRETVGMFLLCSVMTPHTALKGGLASHAAAIQATVSVTISTRYRGAHEQNNSH